MTDEEFREYLIRSNLNRGDFDYDVLADQWNPLDLLKWGFTEKQLLDSCEKSEKILEEIQEEEKKKNTKKCPECGHEFS